MPCKSLIETYFRLFCSTYNGLFYGGLFYMMGVYLYPKEKRALVITVPRLGISAMLLILEVYLMKQFPSSYCGNTVCVMVPFVSFYLFKLVLSIKVRESIHLLRMRKMSSLIYLSHCYIIRCIRLTTSIFRVDIGLITIFTVTLAVSIMFSYLAVRLTENKSRHILTLLY